MLRSVTSSAIGLSTQRRRAATESEGGCYSGSAAISSAASSTRRGRAHRRGRRVAGRPGADPLRGACRVCANMPTTWMIGEIPTGSPQREEAMPTAQPAIFNEMGEHQWYVHLSRTDGADLATIKGVVRDLRAACADQDVNLVPGFGPTLLADIGAEMPNDFQAFETIESTDGSGREAKGTQEELLFWMTRAHKDRNWKTP